MTWNNIPTALQDKQHWAPHKAVKLPLPSGGFSANTNDPTTWSSFQDVSTVIRKNRSANRYTGIGFVFTEADNFAGIDIDGYMSDGKSHPIAKRFTAYPVSPQLWLEKTASHYGDLQKYFTKTTTSKRRNNEE